MNVTRISRYSADVPFACYSVIVIHIQRGSVFRITYISADVIVADYIHAIYASCYRTHVFSAETVNTRNIVLSRYFALIFAIGNFKIYVIIGIAVSFIHSGRLPRDTAGIIARRRYRSAVFAIGYSGRTCSAIRRSCAFYRSHNTAHIGRARNVSFVFVVFHGSASVEQYSTRDTAYIKRMRSRYLSAVGIVFYGIVANNGARYAAHSAARRIDRYIHAVGAVYGARAITRYAAYAILVRFIFEYRAERRYNSVVFAVLNVARISRYSANISFTGY